MGRGAMGRGAVGRGAMGRGAIYKPAGSTMDTFTSYVNRALRTIIRGAITMAVRCCFTQT